MVARYYCDECGNEMQSAEHKRLRRVHGDVRVEVIHGHGATWNGGHVCHACIVKAVLDGSPMRDDYTERPSCDTAISRTPSALGSPLSGVHLGAKPDRN